MQHLSLTANWTILLLGILYGESGALHDNDSFLFSGY